MDDVFRQRATLFRRSWIVFEGVLTVAAFVGAYFLRGLLPFRQNPELYPLLEYTPLALAIGLVWPALLWREKLYHTQRISTLASQWGRLARAHAFGALALAALIFASRQIWISRSLLGIFLVTSFLLLGAERTAVLAGLHSLRRRGRNTRNVVVVGIREAAAELATAAAEHPEWGWRLLGFLRVSDEPRETPLEASTLSPVLGTVRDLPEILENEVVDEIVFCVAASELEQVKDAVAEAELRGVNARLVADFMDLKVARTQVGYLNGLPVLTFTTTPQQATGLLCKRLLDGTLAAMALLVFSPLMGAVAALIRLTSDGPVLFRQERVGQNGRTFTLFKFRTMRNGAEPVSTELRVRNEMNGPVFKLRDDPRVTRLGRVLRRWTLDEIPQFWNVLRGDMSLVGPRPPLPHEVAEYKTWQMRRLSMKPGLTGLWQVSGRNEVDFEEWMELDLSYIDNWSLREDLRILARTIPAVLSGRGAY